MIGRGARNLLVATAAYALVLEVMLFAAIEFWPDFAANIGAIRLLTRLPVVRGLLGVLKEGELPGYVTFQHFFKDCNLLGTAAAVLFAVNAVAGEVHRGTFEIWLARPQSRLRLLSERWIAGAIAVVVPVFLTTWTIPSLLERVETRLERDQAALAAELGPQALDELPELEPLTLELRPLMLGAVHQSCMLLAVFSATFLLSTVGRHPVRIAIGMLFFGVFELATYFVMGVTNWSIVRFVDPRLFVDIYGSGKLDWQICGGLLGCAAVCAIASALLFQRRIP